MPRHSFRSITDRLEHLVEHAEAAVDREVTVDVTCHSQPDAERTFGDGPAPLAQLTVTVAEATLMCCPAITSATEPLPVKPELVSVTDRFPATPKPL